MARKLGPVAWVLIGCAGMVVVAGVTFVALGVFAVGKAKQFADEMQDNPVAAAEMLVRLHPDLEVVSKDEEDRKLTLRVKSSGEEFSIDASKVLEGEISFTNSRGESVRVDAGAGAGESALSVAGAEGSYDVKVGRGWAERGHRECRRRWGFDVAHRR